MISTSQVGPGMSSAPYFSVVCTAFFFFFRFHFRAPKSTELHVARPPVNILRLHRILIRQKDHLALLFLD